MGVALQWTSQGQLTMYLGTGNYSSRSVDHGCSFSTISYVGFMLITANTVANLVANLNANANRNVNNNAGRSFSKERNYPDELDLEGHIFVKSNLEFLFKNDIDLENWMKFLLKSKPRCVASVLCEGLRTAVDGPWKCHNMSC